MMVVVRTTCRLPCAPSVLFLLAALVAVLPHSLATHLSLPFLFPRPHMWPLQLQHCCMPTTMLPLLLPALLCLIACSASSLSKCCTHTDMSARSTRARHRVNAIWFVRCPFSCCGDGARASGPPAAAAPQTRGPKTHSVCARFLPPAPSTQTHTRAERASDLLSRRARRARRREMCSSS